MTTTAAATDRLAAALAAAAARRATWTVEEAAAVAAARVAVVDRLVNRAFLDNTRRCKPHGVRGGEEWARVLVPDDVNVEEWLNALV